MNLDVPAGQITALAGDNGAGKSVTIKTMSGLWEPSEGQILWEGDRSACTARKTPRRSGSPPFTRTWLCATTSTSCRTCSSATSG